MCNSINKIIDAVAYQTISHIYDWVFLGMEFNKNINGQILSIALTFSSNICIIPGRLLLSFRLYRHSKSNAKNQIAKKSCKKIVCLVNIDYFCKSKIGLKNVVNLYQDLTKKCKLFSGRVISIAPRIARGNVDEGFCRAEFQIPPNRKK